MMVLSARTEMNGLLTRCLVASLTRVAAALFPTALGCIGKFVSLEK
jgi:hypothetical protein